MKNNILNISNFAAAVFAFMAAILWILSGGLGEVNLVIPAGDKADAVATGAAKFNTSAAKWALASSVCVMISSVVSIMMKDDSLRRKEKKKIEAERDACLEKMVTEYQEEEKVAKSKVLPKISGSTSLQKRKY